MRFKTLLCFFLIILIPSIYAIGIIPPQYKVNLQPGTSKEYSHTIVNGRNIPIGVSVKISGPLASYITAKKTEFQVPAQGSRTLTYTFNAPAKLKPGWNNANIAITDLNTRGGGMFGIAVGVVGNFKVFSPFPDVYATGGLGVPNVNEGEDVSYKLELRSRGEQDITDADLSLSFLYEGEAVKEFHYDGISIASMETHTKKGTIPGSNFGKGIYLAKAEFDYNADILRLNKTFIVGSYEVNIINHSQVLYAGQITPFSVTIKSNWNGEIKPVYITVEIEGKRFRSNEGFLKAFWKKTHTAYVEDLGFALGEKVPAKITVHFGKEEISKDVELLVIEKKNLVTAAVVEGPSIFTTILSSTTTYLIAAVLILIIVNIILLLRKKRKNETG